MRSKVFTLLCVLLLTCFVSFTLSEENQAVERTATTGGGFGLYSRSVTGGSGSSNNSNSTNSTGTTTGGSTVELPPVVTSIKVLSTNVNKRAASAIVRVAIFGYNFGTSAHALKATVGSYSCLPILLVNDKQIQCNLVGAFGYNLAVVVTKNGLQSTLASPNAIPEVRLDFSNQNPTNPACVSPFGSFDVFNNELCNCWSGYAPLDTTSNTECSVHAKCPGNVISSGSVDSFGPSHPTTTFSGDTIYIKQTLPIVNNKRDTIIQIAAPNIPHKTPNVTAGTIGSATCFYPGTVWQKKVNQLDCLDEYYGAIPWSQNGLCGFVEDTDPTHTVTRVYKAVLQTTYFTVHKKADNSLYSRTHTYSFLLTVSFRKQITSILTSVVTSIADPEDPSSLDVLLTGTTLYDATQSKVILSFDTFVAWPYKIDASVIAGQWAKAVGSTEPGVATVAVTESGGGDCTATPTTVCSQSWVIEINTKPNPSIDKICNLAGTISFASNALLCRDLGASPAACPGTPSPSTNFTVTIAKTKLCDEVETADASKGLEHTLVAYFDSDRTQQQNSYQVGEMVYFAVAVTDPTSTIDAITFAEITLLAPPSTTPADTLYSTTSPVTVPDFNVTQEVDSVIAPGASAVLGFQFRLSRNLLTVLNMLNSNQLQQDVVVSVTIDIAYHGNDNKRSVVTTTSSISSAQLQFYVSDEQLGEKGQANANNADGEANEFSLFAGAASVSASIVMAVVSLLVIFV